MKLAPLRRGLSLAALAAAALQAHRVEGDVDLVVDDDDLLGVDAVVRGQRLHRTAGDVHVGGGLREDHPLAGAGGAETTLQHDGLRPLGGGESPAGGVGDVVQDHLADVVPGRGVLRAGVAESHDEPRGTLYCIHACHCPTRWGQNRRYRKTAGKPGSLSSTYPP